MITQGASADTTSRLVDLLDRVRSETDQDRSDELAAEIHRILEVREVTKKPLGPGIGDAGTDGTCDQIDVEGERC